jgi:hypothetical protein
MPHTWDPKFMIIVTAFSSLTTTAKFLVTFLIVLYVIAMEIC